MACRLVSVLPGIIEHMCVLTRNVTFLVDSFGLSARLSIPRILGTDPDLDAVRSASPAMIT